MARILVIEDESALAGNICEALRDGGHEAEAVGSAEAALAHLREASPDLLLLDVGLPQMDGLEFLGTIRARRIETPVIVLTAHGSISSAVQAMKLGAADFLTKPIDMDALQIVVDRAVEHQRTAENLEYFRRRERAGGGLGAIVGDSPAMRAVKETIRRLATSPAMRGEYPPSVLITGETGSGKDLVARALHYEGPRAAAPLVQVNCTAVPDELFEGELFGHVKGAFTTATANKRGLMDVADKGTIFFDEIGHMKESLQSKLLTAIEQKRIRPIGATSERSINVHVIAATNRDLAQAVAEGTFREDLYHRLHVVHIAVPPLRERKEEIEVLARHFVELFRTRFGTPVEGVTPEGMALLKSHDWPGNVRELSHVLESACLMADARLLGPEHLQVSARGAGGGAEVALPGGATIAIDFEAGRPSLEQVEVRIIEAALAYSDHNVSRAARILGITREAIRYRLEKHRSKGEGI